MRRTEMSLQEMQFAEMVAGGLPQIDAFRRAGYTARTDTVARTGAARLLRRASVRAYLEKRVRENLAVREITLGTQIVELAKLAASPGLEPERQASIRETLIKVLLKITPLPAVSYVLPETAIEDDVARRAIAVADAALQGLITIEHAERLTAMLQGTAEITHGATVAREIRGQIDVTPQPSRQLAVVDGEAQASGNVVRPKWLKPPGGNNGSNGSDPAA